MPYEQQFIAELDHPVKEVRLNAVFKLCAMHSTGNLGWAAPRSDATLRIHTTYSFSPYSPAKAAYMARSSGLAVAGISDCGSVNGADEFLTAADMLHMPAVSGFNLSADVSREPIADYGAHARLSLMGLPHDKLNQINDILAPLRDSDRERMQVMADRISDIMDDHDLPYSFEADVYPLTMCDDGGSVTAQHLLYAMAAVLCEHIGRGQALTDFLKQKLAMDISAAQTARLLDAASPYYNYDLLDILKAGFLPRVYQPDTGGTNRLDLLRGLAQHTGALLTYCCPDALPDTDRLDGMIPALRELGFGAVAYAPAGGAQAQLSRLQELCREHSLLPICGRDITRPWQKLICERQRDPLYADSFDCALALAAHERLITERGPEASIAADDGTPFAQRIARYAQFGRELIS